MDIVGISLIAMGGQVLLRGQASEQRPPVTEEQLRQALAQAGYATCHLLEPALQAAVVDCNTGKELFEHAVGELRPAHIAVVVRSDGMQALIDLTPPEGGRAATLEDLQLALAEAGVTYGLDLEALRTAFTQGQATQWLVASGTPAVHGEDATFSTLTEGLSDRAPKVNADGLIDYREHNGICLVEPHTPLMRRQPATPGLAGRTVTGQTLPPTPGKDLPFAEGLHGSTTQADDANLLCASIKGQPVLVPQGVHVEPVLKVADVSLTTGNIYFDGCVQVDGDVMHSMKVQATGDVSIGGTVEGGWVESGGNVLVTGGIIAGARVRAEGSVTARFTQSATVQAGTVMVLQDMALESELRAGNQILVGEKNPQRGKLVGGHAMAMVLVRAPTVGSDKAGTTSVCVGANPELEERYQALEERIDKEKAQEDNLAKLIAHLNHVGDPKQMLPRVRGSWQQATKTWAKSLVERAELDQQLALTRNAKVQVSQGTSGAVELLFGKRKVALRKEFGAGAFSVDPDNRVQFTEPGGQAYPIT